MIDQDVNAHIFNVSFRLDWRTLLRFHAGMIRPTKRLELAFLDSVPGLLTLLLTMLFLASKHIAGLGSFMPVLPLIPVFYWGMMHAREMPYWFVFLLGLVMDAVMGLPLGMSSLLYIVLLAMLHTQRKYIHKEGFLAKWGYFALLTAVIASLSWIVLSLFTGRAAECQPAVIQWLLTVGCYPVMHAAFDRMYEYSHARRWQILHSR